jgi:hypothetical protein
MGVTGSFAFAQTEDDRAESNPGNVTTCEQAGLAGQTLDPRDVTKVAESAV